jgi:hydroxymethylpyrimidine/phosphomethylpyrimidine kinase
MIEKAIWAQTSQRASRLAPMPAAVRESSLNAVFRSMREACHAGMMPARSPAANVARTAMATTR